MVVNGEAEDEAAHSPAPTITEWECFSPQNGLQRSEPETNIPAGKKGFSPREENPFSDFRTLRSGFFVPESAPPQRAPESPSKDKTKSIGGDRIVRLYLDLYSFPSVWQDGLLLPFVSHARVSCSTASLYRDATTKRGRRTEGMRHGYSGVNRLYDMPFGGS